MPAPKAKPGYYAVLTARVRYDPDLSPNVKLLYAEIAALSDKEGYCSAGNQYFADLYNVQAATVSGWVTTLVEKGYIIREVIRDPDTQQVISRKLRLAEATPPRSGIGDPSPIKIGDPPRYISKENTTSINNKTLSSKEGTVSGSVDKNHPAIQAVRSVTARYPDKVIWPLLAEAIGAEPDLTRLQDCYVRWRANGWSPTNYTWATEWYAKQGPAKPEPITTPDDHRLDYGMLIELQRRHPTIPFNDQESYEEAKDVWLEQYRKRGDDVYQKCLAEIAEYESSTEFEKRFDV